MNCKLSKSAFKRLCLLPLLLIIFILFFYRQIANIYRNVEYVGNMTVVASAFQLFNRQPIDVCVNVQLLNVGQPEQTTLSSYPQLSCTDPGFQIEENNCLVYVIKSQKDEWSLEEAMEQFGCRIYSLLSAPRSDDVAVVHRNLSGSRIRFHWLEEGETVGQVVQQSNDDTILDYMLIRMDSGESEWKILSDLMDRNQLDRVKHLSVGVNLCPDRSSFTESHFRYVLDVDNQLLDRFDMKLFNVANDQSTFFYNPVVKEKTYCASQFAWINQRFRQVDDPQFQRNSTVESTSYETSTKY